MTVEQAKTLDELIGRCNNEQELNQVSATMHHLMDGWKTDSDRYSRMLRDDVLGDEDDDPPALRAAIAAGVARG